MHKRPLNIPKGHYFIIKVFFQIRHFLILTFLKLDKCANFERSINTTIKIVLNRNRSIYTFSNVLITN